MKDLKQIRRDLREIRVYYSNVRGKCAGASVGVPNTAIESLVAKYSEAISKAPIVLYEFYCAMYIEGNTLESLSDKWGYGMSTMRDRNLKLKKFFQQTIID